LLCFGIALITAMLQHWIRKGSSDRKRKKDKSIVKPEKIYRGQRIVQHQRRAIFQIAPDNVKICPQKMLCVAVNTLRTRKTHYTFYCNESCNALSNGIFRSGWGRAGFKIIN